MPPWMRPTSKRSSSRRLLPSRTETLPEPRSTTRISSSRFTAAAKSRCAFGLLFDATRLDIRERPADFLLRVLAEEFNQPARLGAAELVGERGHLRGGQAFEDRRDERIIRLAREGCLDEGRPVAAVAPRAVAARRISSRRSRRHRIRLQPAPRRPAPTPVPAQMREFRRSIGYSCTLDSLVSATALSGIETRGVNRRGGEDWPQDCVSSDAKWSS